MINLSPLTLNCIKYVQRLLDLKVHYVCCKWTGSAWCSSVVVIGWAVSCSHVAPNVLFVMIWLQGISVFLVRLKMPHDHGVFVSFRVWSKNQRFRIIIYLRFFIELMEDMNDYVICYWWVYFDILHKHVMSNINISAAVNKFHLLF